ncbi:hypothetical protein E2562_020219 [Oryza meyeriana var. granulata]|uniref:ZZ-type domain-containing protein n=1 Tax=Oryza meyeriana var. granulata TaxID=110450 RepID=A0A6G1DLT2_9ORYZ|nr:hypothetical protein E2562_020219 [Oryza meyeriana var. granulata]
MSTTLEDQLAQVKSAIDEAFKFVPEQVPIVLAKLSHDLRSKAASSAPSLAELLDRLAKLMAPKSNMQPSSGSADGSSGSSSGGEQTVGKLDIKNETELMAVSASKPLDMQSSGTTKALGLKGVLVDDIKAQVEHVSGCPSFVDTFLGWIEVENKGNDDAQNKRKSVASSAVPHVAQTVHSAPASNFNEGLRNDLFWTQRLGHSYEPFGPNGKLSGDLNSLYPPPLFPRYPVQSLTADRSIKGGCSCTYKSNTSKPDNLSSVCLCGPYSEGTSSIRSPYRDLSDKHESMAQHTLHRWIQCDGCGVTPITGSRYKSNIKDDYDLCNSCFSRMGNLNEYTRIDRPSLESGRFRNTNQMLLPHLQQLHECCFIKDVTVPDGTVMAPSIPFTKIWRMHNNGSSMWPYGTCLIWVGGDQFARHSSVKLGISVDGFPIDQEIDVGVDFVAPAMPGRYISYWRLASPTGQMFGQQVWVLIQVEHPAQTSSNKQTAAINLNLPPVGSSTDWKPFVDMKFEPTDLVGEYSGSTMQAPATDLLTSSAGAEMVSMSAGVPAPEAIPLPKPVNIPASAPAPAPVSVTTASPVQTAVAPISEPTAPAAAISMPSATARAASPLPSEPSPGAIISALEDNMLRELEQMGFRKVDLNKEILRRNEYNLEQSVDELCGILEWDVLHDELHELGI